MQHRLSEKTGSNPSFALLILAAGLSNRFGSDKLERPLKGKPLLQHVLDEFRESIFHPKILVTRTGAETDRFDTKGFEVAVNRSPEQGISSSVMTGIEAIGRRTGSGIIVLLGDMPYIRAQDAEDLVSAFGNEERTVASFEFNGTKGFPTLVTADLLPDFVRLKGDTGIFHLVRKGLAEYRCLKGELRHVFDVDHPEDLERRV
ncbi:MAG TPA: nucleotidyltransferase family protein [Kosmotogaceae bacterium]|nr:MAG: Uncharacterized protein XE05_1262 [Thermotogales bacterium 46_20]HAA84936.1 nucleotidyltransferase family protein [Kosmotogaceae bacterium]